MNYFFFKVITSTFYKCSSDLIINIYNDTTIRTSLEYVYVSGLLMSICQPFRKINH